MFYKPVPSLEAIAIGTTNDLGKLIEAELEELRKNQTYSKYDTKAINAFINRMYKLVKLKTGLNIAITVVDNGLSHMAAISSSMWLHGHSGTKFTDKPRKINETVEMMLTGNVDLKAGKITGTFADIAAFGIMISWAYLAGYFKDPVSSLTAVILHEIGHAFNSVATIGEYVYLNYFLSDGIEIVQGKKQNKYKFEVLSHQYLLKNVPEDQRDEFANNPSDDNVRRAIMSVYKKNIRGHLFDGGLSSKLRDEQSADQYVSRMGYARPLAVALTQMDKYYPGSTGRGNSTWFADTLTAIFMLGAAPIVAFVIMMHDPLENANRATTYDKPFERLMKIRRDLIQQLKVLQGSTDTANLVSDIDAIDKLSKAYTSDRGLFDEAITFFRPSIRKMEQQIENEIKLESLLNNDLFVNAFKLQNL